MKLIQPNIFLYFSFVLVAASGIVFPIIWPGSIGFYAFITTLSVGGLGVTLYIHHTKSNGEELVCPVGSDCNAVITSQYSKFLGISLEYWGMAYYLLILISYLSLIFRPEIFSDLMLVGLFLLTTSAFLFSLYLIFVQGVLLRQWCIWCLLSAVLSITIFITSLGSITYAVSFLSSVENVIALFHAFGFSLGVGGVSVALFLFSRFLKDSRISDVELKTLKTTSEVIWLGLVFTLVTEFLTFVINPALLSESAPFVAQTIALLISGISGAVLMIIFAPLLSSIPFGEKNDKNKTSILNSFEKPFFAASSIAFASWYFAFVMDYVNSSDLLFLLFAYSIALLVGVFVSLVWEKLIEKTN